MKRPYARQISNVDRSIDGIKSASKPLRKLQFGLETQETTGPIFRNTCGKVNNSKKSRMVLESQGNRDMGQISDLLSCNLYKPSKSAGESSSSSLGDPQRNRPTSLE